MATEAKKTGSDAPKKASKKPVKTIRGRKGGIKPKVATILFALIKLSGVGITEASGKLGGNVFSRSKGGAVLRNRVVGTNPQTVSQQMVRSIFGAISSAWRNLNDDQRAAWNGIAEDYPYQNRLGETKILSGKALFQKLNNNLLYAGENLLTSPLAPEGVNAPVDLTSLSIERNIAGDGLSVGTVTIDLATAGDSTTIVVLEATPPLSPGIKNATPRFVRIEQEVAASSTASFNFANNYVGLFGVPAAGTQVQVRAFSVNPATGEKSAAFKGSTIVVQEV